MFHFLVRMNSKKLLFTTTTEKVVDDVNRFVCIFLISTIMSVVWLTIQEVIQMTLNY